METLLPAMQTFSDAGPGLAVRSLRGHVQGPGDSAGPAGVSPGPCSEASQMGDGHLAPSTQRKSRAMHQGESTKGQYRPILGSPGPAVGIAVPPPEPDAHRQCLGQSGTCVTLGRRPRAAWKWPSLGGRPLPLSSAAMLTPPGGPQTWESVIYGGSHCRKQGSRRRLEWKVGEQAQGDSRAGQHCGRVVLGPQDPARAAHERQVP